MRVFITGVAGFLGSHLGSALIADGYKVAGNDNFVCGDIENVPAGANFFHVDCRDFDGMKRAISGCDVVVHCAATAHEGLSSFSPSFITKNIFEASIATFSAAIACGVKRIVYMSSMARYGKQVPPFYEEYTPKPVDCYGIAKVAAEDCLKNLGVTHGVKWCILVPHNIISTRQRVEPFRNVATIMINRCLQGKPPIIYGDGMQRRCFSPVKDCLPSIMQVIHGVGDGEIINIGPDNGEITIKELAERIISMTGFKGYPIHVDDRPNEVKIAYTSSDKARRLLGYKEQQSLDACLMEMIEAHNIKDFPYDFPLEIVTEKTPRTWVEKII
jgi:UDP-glucose 4-epimerase